MFGIDSAELIIIAIVALVVIGPKDLPHAMRAVGQLIGRAKGMARHFRTGMDAMMREAELEDMEKAWAAQNDRIMRDSPQPPESEAPDSDWGQAEVVVPADGPTPPPIPADEAEPPLVRSGPETER